MRISQKCYYSLRALFELTRNGKEKPLAIASIGERQGIPVLFLQTILRELKQGGFVESRRGKEGGYLLARMARKITVGEVIRFVEGEIAPVDCMTTEGRKVDTFDEPFMWLWQEVTVQLNEMFDGVTIAEMVEKDQARRSNAAPDYMI